MGHDMGRNSERRFGEPPEPSESPFESGSRSQAAVPMLLAAPFGSLRDRRDGENPVLIVGAIAANRIQGLPAGTTERQADHSRGVGITPSILPSGEITWIRRCSSHRDGRPHRTYCHPAAAFPFDELALVGQRPVRLNVQRGERPRIGDVDRLLIGLRMIPLVARFSPYFMTSPFGLAYQRPAIVK